MYDLFKEYYYKKKILEMLNGEKKTVLYAMIEVSLEITEEKIKNILGEKVEQ